MCEYRMTVTSPLVCTKQLEEASLRRLDELGVFGYSRGNGGGGGRDSSVGTAVGDLSPAAVSEVKRKTRKGKT
jgi:hypothetical protein